MSDRKISKPVQLFYFFALPLLVLYDELMLRVLTGTAALGGWAYIILFSLAFGFFCFGIISFANGRAARILTDIILWCMTILFAVESVVRSVFTTYMTPENLAFASGNASANYTSQVVRSILLGIPKFLVFAAPVLLFFIFSKYSRRLSRTSGKAFNKSTALRDSSGKHAALQDSSDPKKIRLSLEDSALIAMLSIVLTWSVSLAAANGSFKALYGAQFDYNRATETFGLVTSTRLALKYSIFGNSNVSYAATEFQGNAGSASPDALWADSDISGTDSKSSGTDSAASGAGSESSGTDSTASGTDSESSGTASESTSASAGPSSDDAAATGTPSAAGTSSVSGTPSAAPVLNKMDIDFTSVEHTGNDEVDSLTAYIESRTATAQNSHTGIFKGKNLILICAESYCSDFISPELTPTLWRLTTKGIYCTDYYQPEWGGSTTTGEASFLLGLAPKDGDQTMAATAGCNNYFTMGNQLQRLGYSSCGFHNGSVYYYNRNLTHVNLGYNQFIANENGLGALCGGNYPKDTKCFDKTLDLYLDKQPFSIYYMTASGHAPYDSDSYYVDQYYDRVNEVVKDKYKEKTKYYICAQMELENALTLLVNRLEEAGIADDTVIAMVGDHYPYGLGTGEAWGNDQDYINDLIKGDSTIPFEEDKSGLIIWSECLEKDMQDMACTIDTPVFSLDVLPTLSNLFGLKYDSRLLPGRDIFSDAEPLVFWNNLSWVTSHGKYDARHKKYYPNEGESDDPDYRAAIDAEVQNRILMSRSIVSTDYYGKLFGPDTVTQAGETIFPR